MDKQHKIAKVISFSLHTGRRRNIRHMAYRKREARIISTYNAMHQLKWV